MNFTHFIVSKMHFLCVKDQKSHVFLVIFSSFINEKLVICIKIVRTNMKIMLMVFFNYVRPTLLLDSIKIVFTISKVFQIHCNNSIDFTKVVIILYVNQCHN